MKNNNNNRKKREECLGRLGSMNRSARVGSGQAEPGLDGSGRLGSGEGLVGSGRLEVGSGQVGSAWAKSG